MEPIQTFVQFLQASITPVALISGVGLLLLTITNRLARVVDRARHLVAELDIPQIPRRDIKVFEIGILMKRGKYLRLSIAFITISVIMSCLIIPLLVVMRATEADLRLLGYIFFVLSISSIFISAIFFFFDVLLSLNAIKLEAKEYL